MGYGHAFCPRFFASASIQKKTMPAKKLKSVSMTSGMGCVSCAAA
jgi:hypothetical protein